MMNVRNKIFTALLALALAGGFALAHQSKEVGDGAYRVEIGRAHV